MVNVPFSIGRLIPYAIWAVVLTATSGADAFVIDSLSGDITANEITQFINSVTAMHPSTNNYGDQMADHTTGTTTEAMSRMYEATGNVQILNLLIKWCDVLMSHRDDLPAGEHRRMWDGRVDAVWPPEAATDPQPLYAASESAQVGGHVAWCTELILSRPALWNLTIPDGNPNHYGVTYKQRALKYISLLDAGKSSYDTRWFLDPVTRAVRWPLSPMWTAAVSTDPVGTPVAWNQQMMFVKGYQYLALCHDILGDHPAVLPLYKSVVKTFAAGFVGAATNYVGDGHAVCKWYYTGSGGDIENIGHAQHDVQGLFTAYMSGYTNISAQQMTRYASTAHYMINLGTTDSWSLNVDGTGTPSTSLKTDFIFYAEFDRALFHMIAQSNIDANMINSGSEAAKNTAFILYMKHWLVTH